MYVSSISSFAASWLFCCLIDPLYGETERPYWIPYEVDHPVHKQSASMQSEAASFKEYHASNITKSSYYNVHYRNYQYNSVHPKVPSKNTDVYVTQNATKSTARYPNVEKGWYRVIPRYAASREILKEESDSRLSRLDQHYEVAGKKDEEITKKMNALDEILSEDTENDIESKNMIEDRIVSEASIPEEAKRVVRQVRKQRPGFFWTLARLTFETFNDTRSAIQQISNIINANFEPETSTRRPPVSSNPLMITKHVETTTPSDDQSNMSSNLAGVNVTTTTTTTTTPAPFKLTRTGLQDLIRRNLRGLIRLFNIEWQDALNQSEVSTREFQKNLGNQVGGFLQDNPNAF